MRLESADPIIELLNDLDFPATKQQIVDHARRRGASTEADKALSALPLGEYANRTEVIRSIPLDPAPERSAAVRMNQHRQHQHARLAEHMRDAEPPQGEQELGENRRRG